MSLPAPTPPKERKRRVREYVVVIQPADREDEAAAEKVAEWLAARLR